MERNERYDPEDLEQLMLEHGFDELLEEERTFALRHVDDRREYERMRALLLHVEADAGQAGPEVAAPVVRERVLQAFREARRPQWRIWLNSIGTLLLPARPVHYWRPAMALGSVAVLILASVWAWNTLGTTENKVLAELKEQPAAPRFPSPAAGPLEVMAPEGTVPSGTAAEEATASRATAPAAGLQVDVQAEGFSVGHARTAAPPVESEDLREHDEAVADQSPSAATAEAALAVEATDYAAKSAAPAVRPSMDQGRYKEKVPPAKRRAEASMDPPSGVAVADRAAVKDWQEDELLGLLQAAW